VAVEHEANHLSTALGCGKGAIFGEKELQIPSTLSSIQATGQIGRI
jgi:hypothetical protein